VFGDHFDIDRICGSKNSGESDINKLLAVAMQQYDPDFVKTAKAGDILIAGKSFGYGHPHPQGMKVMRHLGITTIIGKSFARVFFKNEIASG
jgi:3-isopropylmalate/(R)-2-methylmalate dehydratase small subunit